MLYYKMEKMPVMNEQTCSLLTLCTKWRQKPGTPLPLISLPITSNVHFLHEAQPEPEV